MELLTFIRRFSSWRWQISIVTLGVVIPMEIYVSQSDEMASSLFIDIRVSGCDAMLRTFAFVLGDCFSRVTTT